MEFITLLINAGYITINEVASIKKQIKSIDDAQKLIDSAERVSYNAIVVEKKSFEAIRILKKQNPKLAFIKAQMLYEMAHCYYLCKDMQRAKENIYELDAINISDITPLPDKITKEKEKGKSLINKIHHEDMVNNAREYHKYWIWKVLVCISIILSLLSVGCSISLILRL